jgi:pimeloyl-ACP methyl ester carboxylesterase
VSDRGCQAAAAADHDPGRASPRARSYSASAWASWYGGVGHVPHLEEPERFNRELAELTRASRANQPTPV